jgi:hypothetical protein
MTTKNTDEVFSLYKQFAESPRRQQVTVAVILSAVTQHRARPCQGYTGIKAAACQYRLCLSPSGPRPMARSKPTTSSSGSAAGLTDNLSTTS